MTDNNALYHDLTEAFIVYQYRLDNPMPTPNESMEAMIIKYQSDNIFHMKVKSLVSGVMTVVSKHIQAEALKADAKRLDWLDKNATMVSDSERYLPRRVYWGGGTNKNVRQAIDAAMIREKRNRE